MSDWARFRRFILPSLTLAIFLVSLIHSFVKTQTLEEQIGDQVTQAMWVVSETEIDFLQLLVILEQYQKGDPAVSREDVLRRVDSFRMSLPALLEGTDIEPLRALLDDDLIMRLEPLQDELVALSPRLRTLRRDDSAALQAIHAALQPYGPLLRELVTQTHRQDSWRASLYRARDLTIYLEIGGGLAGMIFSGALLVVIMVREIRRGEELLRKSHAAEVALVQARNQAEQANAAKSRFLVAANHDMRQPLQSLSLYTAALQGAGGAPERESICEEMSGAIQTMGHLLDALLDIENLEEGRVRVAHCDLAASDVLASIEREFRLPAQEKGVDLRVVPSSLGIRSDPLLLERIVQNLVSNAISYAPEGKVVAGCRPRGDRVRIEIWDNGVGVAENDLETIFEDYYQVDNPARDRRKGLGLGLAIAQRIARLLDHEITVRSELGKGSVFAVDLPRAERLQVAAAAAAPARAPASARTQGALAGRGVVAIEDDPSILRGIEHLLGAWGAEVLACAAADEALARLASGEWRPNLLLVDYRLADGLNGIDAVEKIRALYGRPLPAIVMTGDTSASVTGAIRASGCYLAHKPLDSRVLRRLIDEQLAVAEAAGGQPDPETGPPAEKLEQV